MFITLLRFIEYLITAFVSLNNELSMGSPTWIDQNPVELSYYYSWLVWIKVLVAVMLLVTYLQKYVFRVKKDVNVKVFRMITKIDKTKSFVKNISCDYKCKFSSTTCNSDQNWNSDKCQYECKRYHTCKEDYSCNPRTCICGNSKHSKSILII